MAFFLQSKLCQSGRIDKKSSKSGPIIKRPEDSDPGFRTFPLNPLNQVTPALCGFELCASYISQVTIRFFGMSCC